MADYSFDAFTGFLRYLSDKGLLKAATAQGYRVAASKVEGSLTEQELVDVRHIDVPTVFQRYVNKNKLKISPDTLRTYQGRLETALAEFGAWRSAPTSYRPRGGARTKADAKRSRAAKKSRGESTAAEPTAPRSAPAPGILTLPYPLRVDFLASVQVPRDMKLEEADRLAAFIRTLAVDYKPA